MICFLICYVMFSSFSFYLFYYHYYYFFFPFFLFFYYTSCTLFPTNKPLHPQCRRLIILEYEGELYRVEVEVNLPPKSDPGTITHYRPLCSIKRGQPSIYFPIGDHVNVSRCCSHTNASGVISTSHIVASHITKLLLSFRQILQFRF